MSSSRVSPARSQCSEKHSQRQKPRKTRSVGSPANPNRSVRLSAVIQDYRDMNLRSMMLSPLPRRSVLTDNTDIDEPRRRSWWKMIQNSSDVTQIIDNDDKGENVAPTNIFEQLDIEVSQEKKDYTLDLLEQSDSESIHSIVMPQKKLFPEKENEPQRKFAGFGTRDAPTKINTKNATEINDKTIAVATKELFSNKQRSKMIFPSALLNLSPNKTSDKTLVEPIAPVRKIFGHCQGNKWKNMFANFIVSDSEDEIPEIQPKVFGFKPSNSKFRPNSTSRDFRDVSPTSNTTDIELDDWKHIPSSTMVENQLEDTIDSANTPKRPRLSKPSEAKISDSEKSQSVVSKSKQSNKSTSSENKLNLSQSKYPNSSISTRARSKLDTSKTSQNKDVVPQNQENYMSQYSSPRTSETSQSSVTTRRRTKSDAVDGNLDISHKSSKNTSNIAPKQDINVNEAVINLSQDISQSQNQKAMEIDDLQDAANISKGQPKTQNDEELNFSLKYDDDENDGEHTITKTSTRINKTKNASLKQNRSRNISKANISCEITNKPVTESNNTDILTANHEISNVLKQAISEQNSQKKSFKEITTEASKSNEITNASHLACSHNKSEQLKENDNIAMEVDNAHKKSNFKDVRVVDIEQNVSSQNVDKNGKVTADVAKSFIQNTKQSDIIKTQVQSNDKKEAAPDSQDKQNNKTSQEGDLNEIEWQKKNEEQFEDNAYDVEMEDGATAGSDEQENETTKEPENNDDSEEEHISKEKENESEDEDHEIENEDIKETAESEKEEQNETDNEEKNENEELNNSVIAHNVSQQKQIESDTEDQVIDDENFEATEQSETEQQNTTQEGQIESAAEDEENEDNDVVPESENEQQNTTQEDQIESAAEDEENEDNDVVPESENEQQNTTQEDQIESAAEDEENEDNNVVAESENEQQNTSQEDQIESSVEDEENEDAAVESENEQQGHNESKQEELNESEEEEQENENEVSADSDHYEQENESNEEQPKINENTAQEESNEIEVGDDMENNEATGTNQIENSQDNEVENEPPNISHDTTGRNRKKLSSLEVIRKIKTNNDDYLNIRGRNTSVNKTNMIKTFIHRQGSASPNFSVALGDGTGNSSAAGSGWDSHRTTRKTLRQTFGKDFTPRKSLRTLVMEKSAKRQTDATSITAKIPLANSTEFPQDMTHDVEEDDEPQELSMRSRQNMLDMHLQKIQKQNMERRLKAAEAVKNLLKPPQRELNPFKVPTKSMFLRRSTTKISKPKAKSTKTPVPLENLPEEFIQDMKYKPHKLYQPTAWATKRLYKFLETKLEPKYDYKARWRAEKLVETLHHFVKDARRHKVASSDAVNVLMHEMARLNIVHTYYEFHEFFFQFMPREIRIKVVPDIVNNIPLPRRGIFANILGG